MAEPIPTVRQYRLAQSLRELRAEAKMTQEQVAARMDWHVSKLFRLENARSPRVNWLDIQGLLDLYGVASPQREALIQLAKDAKKRGWWTSYQDVFTGSLVALEDETHLIRRYSSELIPGLLQTEAYARAVIQALRPRYDEQSVERRVTARMARQRILKREKPLHLDFVLNEAVLRRQVGDNDLMAEQLQALRKAAEDPDVTLRLLSFDAGAHSAMEGAFTIFSFPEDQYPDVVYIEGMMGDLYLESVESVNRYRTAFESLRDSALSPSDTMDFITSKAREFR
ncbi:helix-turn-helix domain-containing protein [Nocardiopsis halotolerans]|uniref:helix-turn-helix domain-containing protein n=1 Tax=Nocardiopsis halotolerans TaxID=124252 RepID=UPI00037665BC|nr:helix-turn-helix transcriptional regulator [Nocardiopsis halotolerans]